MSCLAETISTVGRPSGYDEDMEEQVAEADFRRHAMEEIRRYQRIDEWIPSFHNVYTTTALDCHLRLMKNWVIPRQMNEFLPYTRFGNADNVRLKAMSCLVELGWLLKPAVARWLLYLLEDDPSPYVRFQLLLILELGVGQIALGELQLDNDVSIENANSLVVEQDNTNQRAAEHARKTTVEGALAALKQELEKDPVLARALESALRYNISYHSLLFHLSNRNHRSRITSFPEVHELVEICSFLYQPEDKHIVKLKFPHYWKVQHLGNVSVSISRRKQSKL